MTTHSTRGRVEGTCTRKGCTRGRWSKARGLCYTCQRADLREARRAAGILPPTPSQRIRELEERVAELEQALKDKGMTTTTDHSSDQGTQKSLQRKYDLG